MKALPNLLLLLIIVSESSVFAAIDESRLNFLAFGDWGGVGALLQFSSLLSSLYPVNQKDVAKGMAQVAQNLEAEFVVALGDNFYMRGISGGHPFDRVQQTFEDVYTDPALQIPWYVIGGNHDHYGNITAQLEYSNYSKTRSQLDPNYIHRWEFPSLYYKRSFQRGNLTLDLILIDTVLLEQATQTFWRQWIRKDRLQKGMEQWTWLETALQESSQTADYVLVGGHYPVFSQGGHGPTTNLVQNLKPLLEKYNAQVYLAGHEHSMMHFQQEENGVAYVVSGAGNSCCSWRRSKYQKKHEKDFPDVPLEWHMFYQDNYLHKVKGGFCSIQATMESLIIEYYDQDGNLLYTADPILPRKKSLVGVDKDDADIGIATQ